MVLAHFVVGPLHRFIIERMGKVVVLAHFVVGSRGKVVVLAHFMGGPLHRFTIERMK